MKHAREDYNRIQDPDGLIPEDEPVFLLRGQDEFAWRAVFFYAQTAKSKGGDPEIVKNALEQSNRMRHWSPQKSPDMPSEPSK
ncbi:hypothetical protein LCGC14_0412090 [marine sediment metagenome]|uniref:Uncharacterized protein n=1 Tax=marine sediment metagenome TaxID=412755 RepID=A0A0F9W2F8_9ZZZZ